MSHSRVLAHFVSHKGYAKSTQLNLSVATDNFFILFLTLQNQIEENNWKNSNASEKFEENKFGNFLKRQKQENKFKRNRLKKMNLKFWQNKWEKFRTRQKQIEENKWEKFFLKKISCIFFKNFSDASETFLIYFLQHVSYASEIFSLIFFHLFLTQSEFIYFIHLFSSKFFLTRQKYYFHLFSSICFWRVRNFPH